MIKSNWFANFIQEKLNDNNIGVKFMVFADAGTLKEYAKIGNYKENLTNCVAEILSSQIIPIKNISFNVFNTQTMIVVDLDALGTETITDADGVKRKQSKRLIEVQEAIYQFINAYNGTTINQVIDGKTYAITLGLTMPTDGERMSIGAINEGLALYLPITFTIFENGVNSQDFKIKIDGEDIYFLNGVITRLKVTEQNPYYYSKASKASLPSNAISIDFSAPQITSELCEKIENEIWNGKDYAYCVELSRNGKVEPYICACIKEQQNISGTTNIGLNLSFVEVVEDLVEYEENKWVKLTIEATENEQENLFQNTSEEEIVIFWGDGSKEITKETNIIHKYKEQGTYEIYAYCASATTNDWFKSYYTISYNLDGGSANNPTAYTNNDLPITLNNPTKKGYTFKGWTGTGLEEPTLDVTITEAGNKNYTAVFEIINYSISYNYGIGTEGEENPTSYNVETETFTLNNPNLSSDLINGGWKFTGWTGTDLDAETKIVNIEKGSIGNREYVAKYAQFM